VCWLDNVPSHTTKYLLKHNTSQIFAKITTIHNILDINTLENSQTSENLNCNDIAKISISLQKPLYLEKFKHNIFTGAFILIDEVSHRTVAAGFIDKL
jgi:sulfate adenylyltransferase subunit 1